MCQVELQDIVNGCRGVHVEDVRNQKNQKTKKNQKNKKNKIAHPNPLHLTPSPWGVQSFFFCFLFFLFFWFGWSMHMCQVELQDIVSDCRWVYVDVCGRYTCKKQCKNRTARVSPSVKKRFKGRGGSEKKVRELKKKGRGLEKRVGGLKKR